MGFLEILPPCGLVEWFWFLSFGTGDLPAQPLGFHCAALREKTPWFEKAISLCGPMALW